MEGKLNARRDGKGSHKGQGAGGTTVGQGQGSKEPSKSQVPTQFLYLSLTISCFKKLTANSRDIAISALPVQKSTVPSYPRLAGEK